MNAWMNEWMNECMNEWINGWMNGWMKKHIPNKNDDTYHNQQSFHIQMYPKKSINWFHYLNIKALYVFIIIMKFVSWLLI